jgi:hypothetical protein
MQQFAIPASYLLTIALFLAAQLIAFITLVVTHHVRTTTRIKELEVRMQLTENNAARITEKLDNILGKLHEIDVKVEKKQDR